MWICRDCGEKLEDQFDSCWKCSGKLGDVSAASRSGQGAFGKTKKGFLTAVVGVAVFVFFVLPLAYKFFTATVYKSHSPAGVGVACFFRESDAFVSVVELYVKDYERSRLELVTVGTVSGIQAGRYPIRAVWSGDGSVIAVRSGYVEDGQAEAVWTHAYDFREHASYGESSPPGSSDVIKELLKSRGGEGQVVFATAETFRSLLRPYYPWELFPVSKFP